MALMFTSSSVVASDGEAELVSAVSTVEATDGDALGQRECGGFSSFTPGPDENPLHKAVLHQQKNQHRCCGHSQRM